MDIICNLSERWIIVAKPEDEIKIINYQEERETYLATLAAIDALGIKYIPTIYSYKTKNLGMMLNSCALGYGNNINIFLSYYLFNTKAYNNRSP